MRKTIDLGEGAIGTVSVLDPVLRYAANQIPRIAAIRAEKKRRQRRRGRFAMGTSHDDVAPVLQYRVMQEAGQRCVLQRSGFKQPLDLRVPARHRVADHHEIWRNVRQTHRIISLEHSDASSGENRAHWRIYAAIRSQHFVAGRPDKERCLAHRCPADPHEINLHVPLQWPFCHAV